MVAIQRNHRPVTSDDEDRALITRISTGEKDAMRQLYERHHNALSGFIRARSVDPSIAADVVQDAMLEVWRSAAQFRGASSVRTWIFTIGRNKLVDRTRRESRLSYTDDVPDIEDDAPNPEAVLASVQDAGRVRDCLATLKEVQRAVMRLAFFDGLSYAEIAELEGIPKGTVKTRVMHAKQALLRCLGHR